MKVESDTPVGCCKDSWYLVLVLLLTMDDKHKI